MTHINELFVDYPDVVTVPQVCEMLGNVNPNLVYKLLCSGAIPSIKIGRLRRVLKQSVIDYVQPI